MRVVNRRMVWLGMFAALGLGLKANVARRPLPFVEEHPRTTATVCCLEDTPLTPRAYDIYLRPRIAFECATGEFPTYYRALQQGLFESQTWKDFAEITAPLSNNELAGFGGLRKYSANRYHCNLIAIEHAPPQLRESLLLRAFMNITYLEDFENIDSNPYLFDKEKLRKDVETYQRLSRIAVNLPNAHLYYSYPQFIYASSPEHFNIAGEGFPKQWGKWEIMTTSRENATQTVECLLPCLEAGEVSSLKFDLEPFAGRVYRVIVYANDRDPHVAKILQRITKQNLIWIFEHQTNEASALDDALFSFSERVMAEKETMVTEESYRATVACVQDREFMLSLGLSEFQYDVLIRGLALEEHTDLNNPTTYCAHDTLRETGFVWSHLIVALRPENQKEFAATLATARERNMEIFRD